MMCVWRGDSDESVKAWGKKKMDDEEGEEECSESRFVQN